MQTDPSLSPSLALRARAAWGVAIAYVAFIYLSLGAVPAPLAYLRSLGILRFTLNLSFIACWISVVTVLAMRSRQAWRFAALAVLAGAYALVARAVVAPEEQIHFIQYGLVGVLFARALRYHLRREAAVYAAAFAIAFAVGWFDEILQGQLPNRHYDVRDIYLNAVSAFLGLLVYRVIPRRRL